nr:nonribosomal peptide synthetase tes [Quercus suber]
MLLPLDESASRQMSALVGSLSVQLPSYMVPTVYVPVKYMPSTTSHKTDRRRLRAAIDDVEDEDFLRYMLANAVKEVPATEMEALMQKLWADVLGLPAEIIGRHDSFLQLGGDSIAAIRLVAAARRKGIQLTVSVIFNDPRLSQVASSVKNIEILNEATLEPWSQVPYVVKRSLERDVREQCGLTGPQFGTVLDVYPTTALQEGLMALSAKKEGSYMARYEFELDPAVNIVRFKAAWEQTVQACAALRSRIVLSDGSSWQAIIQEGPKWESVENITSFASHRTVNPMSYGSALCRYGLARDGEQKVFYLTLHHAIFDGWSLGLIMQTLCAFFDGRPSAQMELPPYAGFIRYTASLNSALASEYWRAQLQGATRPVFPRAQPVGSSSISKTFSHTIPFSGHSSSSITRATILRAAWAIVLARYNDNTDDITFGAAVAGRQAPVSGIERMVGPVISTVPIRVKLSRQQSIIQYLRNVQAQGAEMIPYEQTGLQNIMKLGHNEREACGFSSLFVIQPEMIARAARNSLFRETNETRADLDPLSITAGYFTYPLVVQCHLGAEMVRISITFDGSILRDKQIETIVKQYEHVVQQLLSAEGRGDPTQALHSVTLCGPRDVEEVRSWNTDCPDRGRVIVLPHDGGGPGQEAAAGTGHLCLGRRVLLQRAQCGSGPARSSPRRKHGRCDWRSGHTVLREVRVGVCGNAGGQQGGWSLGATGPVTPTTPSPAGDQPGRRSSRPCLTRERGEVRHVAEQRGGGVTVARQDAYGEVRAGWRTTGELGQPP